VGDCCARSTPSFNDRWYSGTLSALQEPSLLALRNDKSIQAYRFLWLPSVHRPISVRLTINADGTGAVVTRSVDSHAGLLTKPASDTGKLIQDATSIVDEMQVKEALAQLQRLTFWSMPTEGSRLFLNRTLPDVPYCELWEWMGRGGYWKACEAVNTTLSTGGRHTTMAILNSANTCFIWGRSKQVFIDGR
jgi:hypothetical protein